MAWNLGRRTARAGRPVSDLSSLGDLPALVELGPREVEALLALGGEGFHLWAVRGWFGD